MSDDLATSAASESQPGTTAGGTPAGPPGYELLDEIGRGGMGVVYRADDVALGRDVAVKLLAQRYPLDSPAAQRFLSEARITGQLQHPGIPAVHQVGNLPDGRPFLAMKLIKGCTLEAILKDRPDPSAERGRLLAAFEAVCQAVGYAHAHRVIHRDLKPANIMVGGFGEVQVMDWGLAKVLTASSPLQPTRPDTDATVGTEIRTTRDSDGSFTQAGTMLGTPAFMPPEQAGGEVGTVDERADVFGLGAILAVILTGKPPYAGPDSDSIRLMAIRGQLGDCLARLDGCGADPELVALCKRCLAVERDGRPHNAEEVAVAVADLRAAAEERARQAELNRVRSEGERARAAVQAAEQRKRRRMQRALAATAVGLLTATGFAGAIATMWQHAEGAKQEADVQRQNAEEEKQIADGLRNEAESAWKQEASLRTQLRDISYLHQVGIAHREWRDANLGRARTLLSDCPKDLRAWEWHYVRRLCQPEQFSLTGHDNVIWSVAWSSDGKRIATAADDGTVRLWDADSGRELRRWSGLGRRVWGVAFSPDGSAVAACGEHSLVLIWDTLNGHELKRLEEHGAGVNSVAFSPDGKWLACCTGSITRPGTATNIEGPAGHEVKVWDWRAGKEVHALRGHTRSVSIVAFSPGGRFLASAGWDASICLWDVKTGTLARKFLGHAHNLRGLVFSPDSLWLASSCEDRTLRLWDVTTGDTKVILDDWRGAVSDAAFSPDGQSLACVSYDQTVRIVASATGKTRLVLRGHSGRVLGVAYSPDGRRLVSVGTDGVGKVWDLSLDPEGRVLSGHAGWVEAAAFSPDGKTVATASSDAVHLWNRLGESVRKVSCPGVRVYGLAVSPDGCLLAGACSDRMIRLWDVKTAEEIQKWAGHSQAVRGLAFSRDGKLLASIGFDQRARLWRMEDRTQVFEWVSQGWGVAISPDGRRVAAGGPEHKVNIWDSRTGQLVDSLAGHENAISSVAFSPNGRQLLSGSWDRTARLWDLATGRQDKIFRGHEDAVISVAFSPDGRRFVTASDDRRVKVVTTSSGEEALNLSGHLGPVYSVAFSPDGHWLVSGGWDGTARLWNGSPIQGNP